MSDKRPYQVRVKGRNSGFNDYWRHMIWAESPEAAIKHVRDNEIAFWKEEVEGARRALIDAISDQYEARDAGAAEATEKPQDDS